MAEAAEPHADVPAQAVPEPAPRPGAGCCSIWCPPAWLVAYCLGSTLALILAVYHAFDTRGGMYPALVFLSTSNVNLLIIGNFVFMLVLGSAMVTTAAVVGAVENDELERVWSSGRFAVIGLVFNLTVFREDLTGWTLLRFVLLMVAKYFHELFDARVDNLERHGMAGWFRHVRFCLGMAFFAALDVVAASVYAQEVTGGPPSAAIMFAFEHACLGLSLCLTAYRYALWSVEQRMGREWRDKSGYFVWGSLAVNALLLAVNVVYVYVIYRQFGVPLFMVKDVLRSWHAVQREMKTIGATMRLRRMMRERFTAVRPDEMAAMEDRLCVCCYHDIDEEGSGDSVFLPCGHVFHVDCLMRWFDHGEGCPTCRLDLFGEEAARMLREQQRRRNAPPANANRRQAVQPRSRSPEPGPADPPAAPAPQPPAGEAPESPGSVGGMSRRAMAEARVRAMEGRE